MATFGRAIVEVIYPECCAVCGIVSGNDNWVECGESLTGLRRWDRPHLCLSCYGSVVGSNSVVGTVTTDSYGSIAVGAGAWTSGSLVGLVGDWKYHGVRGLAWPLAAAAATGCQSLLDRVSGVDYLVPVPLHNLRRRSRGFNQAELIALLVGHKLNLPVLTDVVIRNRNTRQQAKIQETAVRQENTSRAFSAGDLIIGQSCRIGLVDDLVTSGATMGAVAQTLGTAGYDVKWGLAIGLAKQHVDSIMD